jgi:riboflavin synthase
MFSGIIDRLGTLRDRAPADAAERSVRLRIATGYADLELGESVAVNGVCLTVASLGAESGAGGREGGEADFFVSPETLRLTQLGALRTGQRVNLERAVSLATRLSGHLVQGHVDGLGRVEELRRDDAAWLARFRLPKELARYCVPKGSIALNGVSLTLNTVDDDAATGEAVVAVQLIPHTWTHTTFQDLATGDPVNVEVDVIAKYVERLALAQQPGRITVARQREERP